jgi:hypothetical protein
MGGGVNERFITDLENHLNNILERQKSFIGHIKTLADIVAVLDDRIKKLEERLNDQ